ncbi:MAG: DoxX family protein, partial [Bacteroidales bacterium]|nr:DoxX family protein [Bacteroidales bacterium]
SGCFIYFVEGYSLPFLVFNISMLAATAFCYRSFQLPHIHFSRYLLSVVFIFSGFVKGVDPVGTQYQIEDYFIAYGTEWARPYAFMLSIILNSFEFILGILLLFRVRMKLTGWILLMLMLVFTLTTLNDALYNPVPDCGCFGDAIKMTNWQTLYKNLVINIFVFIIFAGRKKLSTLLSAKSELMIFFVTVALFIGFEIYNIRHLPVIDFRDWREGKQMILENPMPKETYVTFKNRSTGEQKEYLSPDYPFDDTVWISQWEFVDTRIIDPNPRLHELYLTDKEGSDVTSLVIENPDFQIIFVSFDLQKMNLKNLDVIKGIIAGSDTSGISAVFLTSSLAEDAKIFVQANDFDAEVYYADDTELQAMIRSNPGMVLMKGGTVIRKWHNNDIPDFDELYREFLIR